MNGWQYVARQLGHLGVRHVFGLPGTQNAELFSELAKTDAAIVPASSEKAAAFSAIGYAIGTGQPGLLLTIAGPGFCFTAAPLVEALHDSVALVNIVVADARQDDRSFQLQDIDHEGIAARLAKAVRSIADADDLVASLEWAWRTAKSSEPGPVVLLVTSKILNDSVDDAPLFDMPETSVVAEPEVVEKAARLIAGKSVLILAGRGAAGAQAEIGELAEGRHWPVMTTASGRGVIDETGEWAIPVDGAGPQAVNAVIAEFDLVIAVGVKFTHNGSLGFRLRIPEEKLVHVDSSDDVLDANYPARLSIRADARSFCRALFDALPEDIEVSPLPNVGRLRQLIDQSRPDQALEPDLGMPGGTTAAAFFDALMSAVPDDTIFVTDSGYHQVLARRYLVARFPGQVVVPTDFQSMGFGLPAAIGLALAGPARKVVVIHGDGGLQMCAPDLLTAAAEGLNVLTCVFDDGKYGLIRRQQLASGNPESGVSLPSINYPSLAHGFNVAYVDGGSTPAESVRAAAESDVPTLFRVNVTDSKAQARTFAANRLKGQVRDALGDTVMGWVRRRRGK